jgi:hypothetical protein
MKPFKLILNLTLFVCSGLLSAQDYNPNKTYNSSNFNFSANYGFSQRVAKIPNGYNPEQKNYIKDLKSGTAYNFKASYLKDGKTILGLVYSSFKSKAFLGNQDYTEIDGTTGSGTISDDIKINFIGIGGGLLEKGFSSNDAVLLEVYLGYISYQNDFNLTNNYKLKGGNLGISADVSYYFGITKNIKIGPSISFNGGVLKKFKLTGSNGYSESITLEDDSLENLYRFDLMVGTFIQL